MSPDYSPDLYESRDIDETLRKAAQAWLRPNNRLRWVSLRSRPGVGNSWLLRHFRDWVDEYEAGFEGMKVIAVRGDPLHYPSPAGPLIREVWRLNRESQGTTLQRALRRVRRASPRRKAMALLILLGFLIPACLWAGVTEYNKNPETHLESARLWAEGFLTFARANWYKFPLWLVTDALLGFFVSFGIGAFTLYLSRGRLFPDNQLREAVKTEDLAELKTDEKLAEALSEIDRNRRGIVVVVDDAQWLSEDEKQLLIDLVAPPAGKPEMGRFAERHRILVVTLESLDVTWDGRPEHAAQTYDVPDFTPEAAGRIAWTQLKDELDPLSEPDREELLRKGLEDINNLFANRAAAFDAEVGAKFEEARKGGFASVFGRKDLMVFWAVSQSHSVTKSAMLDWLASLEAAGYLRDFGLKPPADPQLLVSEFPETTLAFQEGQTYFFDVPRCQALQRVLANGSLNPRGGDPGESLHLLARAHYGWFRLARARIPAGVVKGAADWPEDSRQALRESVWHISRIGLDYLERPPDVLARAGGLTAAEREERRYEIAHLLLAAASIYRGEGNTTEANDLVADAVEWLPEADEPRRREWLEGAAGQLWQNFWLSGGRASVKHLRELLARWPALKDTPTWRANRRLKRLLCCRPAQGPAPPEAALTAELINLHRLTETLCRIRQTHGLTAPALADPTLDVGEPVAAPGKSLHEAQLRQLRAAAWGARGNGERLAAALRDWRARLEGAAPRAGRLGDEALHCYEVARYWHTLADLTRADVRRIEEDEDIPLAEEERERARLFESVRGFCLTPPDASPLPDFLWQEARAAYERSRQLATFLYWRPLVMEVCFREGELLREHTPEGRRVTAEGGKPWWWRWDRLFWQAINLEREFGWIVNTPAMHYIRWQFFSEKEDQERSVEDAYNALQSIKRARYPLTLILDWHNKVGAKLTNHSDSDEDRRRDAQLNEEWAEQLAALPEARAYWRYETLELEQANALHFAAQARRFVRELDHADRLLGRAEELVAASAPTAPQNGGPDDGDPDPDVARNLRELKIGLSIQRAWLRQAQEREDDYRAAVREIWRDIRPDDRDCAILLGSLAQIEHDEKLLGDSWPAAGAAAHEDPDNSVLSLPAEWFGSDFPLRLKNRFEFRFYQLLNIVNYIDRMERLGSGAELAQLPALLGFFNRAVRRSRHQLLDEARGTSPDILFSADMLKMVARLGWLGTSRFAEISHLFAAYGQTYSHTAETRSLLVNILDAARFYFAEVERVDSDELKTLQLLMHYEPRSPRNYRLEYVRVLIQQKHVLEHEELSRAAAGPPDWYAAANRIHKYLHVLVDDELLDSGVRVELQRLGVSEKDFYDRRARRRSALAAASEKYEGGDRGGCSDLLASVLPGDNSPWVFIEDLQALHLWLRCAARAAEGGPDRAEVARREAQMRALALQYIRQFKVVIREEEVRRLVSGVLGGLHDTAN